MVSSAFRIGAGLHVGGQVLRVNEVALGVEDALALEIRDCLRGAPAHPGELGVISLALFVRLRRRVQRGSYVSIRKISDRGPAQNEWHSNLCFDDTSLKTETADVWFLQQWEF